MPIPAIIGKLVEGAKATGEVAAKASKEVGKKAGEISSKAKDANGKFNPDTRIRVETSETSVDVSTKYNPDKRIKPSTSVEKLQNECIEKAEKTPDLNNLDSQAKGNYAEMKVDRDLAGKGYERISRECVTDLKTPTGPGIDGVFVNKETGKTLITETKFNKSELGNTLDGKQMSSSWIDNRLDTAVGKEMADKIRMDSILNPDSVQSVLAKVDLNCDVSYFQLDDAANILGGIEL